MQLDNISVVARREYLTRIKGKGFWIGTLVLPLFVVGVTVIPSLVLARSEARQKVVVVDETGQVAEALRAELARLPEARDVRTEARNRRASFDLVVEPPAPDRAAQREALNRRVLDKQIDAWVWIGPRALQDNKVEYHARSVSNFLTQDVLGDHLTAALRQVRLRQAGLDPERVGKLTEQVELDTVRVSKEGSRAEGGLAGAAFAYLLFMMLYITIALWGQQVMLGVLEEKGTRIVEVLVSTVKPLDLMIGKLVGICLLGLTQIGIWLVTLIVATAPGVLAAVATLPEGMKLPVFTVEMAVHFLLLYTLGFFLYSTFYAAVGAAFNNQQEAQQVAGMLIFFLIAPVALLYRVINDPDSTVAVVASLIPLFAPLVMTLRVAIQMPPLWQLLLCYSLLAGFTALMIWICARVYRVGILMYGKKPSFQEIWRWIRYV
jgi:ABC-2 type transport system permease protein